MLFDFVNFYGILIYIAVGKIWVQKSTGILGNAEWAEQCLYQNCMMELTIQMTVIFIGRSLLQHLLNFLGPLIERGWSGFRRSKMARNLLKKKIKKRRRTMRDTDETLHLSDELRIPQYFADANLADIEYQITEMDGYNAATVQFGFLVLFSVSFPLAPLLAAFHNTIQRKIGLCQVHDRDSSIIDAHNLLVHYKRPFALQAQSIGVWETWLTSMAYLGVAMNAATIAFSSPYFESQYLSYFDSSVGKWAGRLGFILLFEHAVLGVQLLLTSFMPAVPRKVTEGIRRQDQIERLLRGDREELEESATVQLSRVCCF